MSNRNNALGIYGEELAVEWLTARGWSVLARRFVSGHRDIDIVAAYYPKGSTSTVVRTVAFVEVKARRSSAFGGPLAAVTWKKQRELRRSANIWIDRMGRRGDEYRFDVVGVLIRPDKSDIEHIENAFLIPNRS